MRDRARRLTMILTAALAASAAPAAFAADPAPKPAPVRYKTERSAEDYRFLRKDGAPSRPWDGLKLIELGGDATLTFGGDLRMRYESADAPRFGLGGAVDDSYMLYRVMAHADLHVGDGFRVFGQIAFLEAADKLAPTSYDQTYWDVGQLFVDVGPVFARGTDGFGVRVGRQEMTFGSPRFLVIRDAFNWRARYDGVRAAWQGGDWRVDVLGVRPVLELAGAWDDEDNETKDLYGVRVQRQFAEKAWRASVGLFKLDQEAIRWRTTTADDRRWTLDARIEGKSGPWDLDAELLYQFGEFGTQDISAWGFLADGGYTIPDVSWKPRIGFRALYGSGDDSATDGELNDFQPPFGSTAYISQSLLIGYPNSTLLGLVGRAQPTPELTVEARVDFVWRNTSADAIYAGTGALPGTTGRAGDDLIGTAPALTVTWKPIPETTFFLFAMNYDVSGALEAAGAQDASYVAASAAFQF